MADPLSAPLPPPKNTAFLLGCLEGASRAFGGLPAALRASRCVGGAGEEQVHLGCFPTPHPRRLQLVGVSELGRRYRALFAKGGGEGGGSPGLAHPGREIPRLDTPGARERRGQDPTRWGQSSAAVSPGAGAPGATARRRRSPPQQQQLPPPPPPTPPKLQHLGHAPRRPPAARQTPRVDGPTSAERPGSPSATSWTPRGKRPAELPSSEDHSPHPSRCPWSRQAELGPHRRLLAIKSGGSVQVPHFPPQQTR